MGNKARSLITFVIVSLVTIVAAKVFNWYVTKYYLGIVPSFVNYIFAIIVLVPLFWSGFEVMDAWLKPKK